MNQLDTGEAAEAARGRSDLQKELAEVVVNLGAKAVPNAPDAYQ
jgi:hypothetical protein